MVSHPRRTLAQTVVAVGVLGLLAAGVWLATSLPTDGVGCGSTPVCPAAAPCDVAPAPEVVAAVPGTPVMRKDFLVEPVQVLEGRKAGASGVLLITTMLSDAKLRAMLDCAFEHNMFVLLESFDEEDLRRSTGFLDADGDLLIGVNTRDLRTLEVDAERLQRLAPLLPDAKCVAESGLHAAEDAARAKGWGYSMALVGTALMRSDDPAALITAMRDAGSAACS